MKKKTTFAIISILSFIISACFTIALFTSNSVGKFATLTMLFAAVVFEMSKWCLLWEGFSDKHNGGLRTILVSLWAFVTIGSIVASCGYVLNQSNKTENKALISSTEYQQAQQARNAKLQAFEAKKAEIEQLKQQANELPRNYYSMKQNIMDKVNIKSKELATISDQLQQPIKVNAPLAENGYTAFFNMAGKLIEEDPKLIELYFFMLLGIVLELIANVFAYLYQKERNVAPKNAETHPTAESKRFFINKKNNKKSNNRPSFAPNIVQLKNYAPKNVKTKPDTNIYDEKDIEDYIKVMYENEKNGFSPGTKTMADLLGWGRNGEEKARGIKNYLELKGLVKVVGNRTKIIEEVV